MVDDVLGTPGELGAKVLTLGGDAGGTGVQVALPRHVTAQGNQHAGAEAELLGAQKSRHDDVPAAAQPAVGAEAHAFAQAVRHEHLLRLGQSELPRHAGILDGRKR